MVKFFYSREIELTFQFLHDEIITGVLTSKYSPEWSTNFEGIYCSTDVATEFAFFTAPLSLGENNRQAAAYHGRIEYQKEQEILTLTWLFLDSNTDRPVNEASPNTVRLSNFPIIPESVS